MVRIAINGFGRIGRQVLRIGINDPNLEFVAVNDLTDEETLAHLLKYDSVHGNFEGDIHTDGEFIVVNGKKVKVLAERDPTKLPWNELDIDVVVECTGIFRTKEKASMHLTAGAKKVIISAPAKGDDPVRTIVMGVNEHEYNKDEDHIVSNASCTTNCLAPIAKVLHDNFKIKKGFMTTIHSYTNDQKLLDLPHRDLRRARAAAINMIPTTTGAAIAVTKVIPELHGNLDGIAIRVPTPDGSITDFVCEVEKETTAEEVNKLFKDVSNHHLKNIVEYTEEPIVLQDIVNNPHSAIFDASLTKTNGNLIKVLAWYDNEWGYSCRLVDLIRFVTK
ncbi:type I glyceraldehyde-3-phosphate dehydrogenase [archaeon]|jgi:glyceraldehyde 3-phosphate dehydrogenase|nr:type I glyceraldehyde-3-phosphate dehydrogenase [archaeon]MBT4352300.1 type I glyceraldehyde-3-phosphate dehydrogenase [archaeon]MBT4647969.1 type I glyceraldehyde-3-phosphate dehydrogenase [archaeon]MBT7391351.1 type I glyceraldehyde-3-phosphate dehydrogenase [archaeon]